MMETYRYVILGGGMVAGYAAKEFVEHGLQSGELGIISADTALPYERPPLSKGFLAGKETEDSLFINDAAFYQSHGIAVHLNTTVERIDLERKRLSTDTGGEIGFETLLIATGARPRTLDLPGANLAGVLYLRTLNDSQHIHAEAINAHRAIVVGGGFIGMEVASVLAQLGIQTTLVLSDERVGHRIFTPEISDFFQRYYKERGVQFIPKATITAINGNGRVTSITLADGTQIPADMVVAGIGVVPNTDVVAATELMVRNGIVVNEYLETNVPNVYAAGDVALYQDVLFNKQRRVEHWDNAVSQGQHLARMLPGTREPFVHVPYFFSDLFDLSYEFWGDKDAADQVIHRGSFDQASISAWWLQEGRLVAAFVLNRPDEERELAPEWIAQRRIGVADVLRDATRSLRTLEQPSG